MDQTRILEILRQMRSGDTTIETALRKAMASFSTQRSSAIKTILSLQASNPALFALAAARVLGSVSSPKPAGADYVAGLIARANALVDPLLDVSMLTDEEAFLMASDLVRVDPLLDARLMHKMFDNADDNVAEIPTPVAQRVLRLVGEISDCSRLTTSLMRLARHPSPHVRSKAALLSGRGNLNLSRVERFLASDDDRTRANAIESLWGQTTPQARGLFRLASLDPNRRVAINALVGLCKAGETEARQRLLALLQSEDAISRRGAIWAMGQTGDPEFGAALDALADDPDESLREMAARSRSMLRPPPSVRVDVGDTMVV